MMPTMNDDGQRNLVLITAFAVGIGAVAGVGAWAFRQLIGLFHNILFLGEFSFDYVVTQHTPPSPWGAWIIAVPPAVAILVAWMVKTFAPEAKGHGVPEVMDAIHYHEARIRPQVVVVKALASSLSIGSGGSAGREGPIIQIGAAMGSTVGQIIAMPVRQRITLVAAGAGAGIAAAFNAPLGGIMFACELMLLTISARTLLPVSLACVVAAWITRMTTGIDPALDIPDLMIPEQHAGSIGGLALFLVLGIVIGGLSSLFIRALDRSEDIFEALPGGYIVQHVIGMTLLGVLIYVMLLLTGRYDIQGVGYATILDVLTQALSDPWFLIALALLKMLATCLTLGSGASGGIFSPALFMGAAVGAAFGHLAHDLFPALTMPVPAFAVAGMAAAVAGSTGALLTAIVMSYEMTRDYNAILPVIVTCSLAWAVRKNIVGQSIYTIKLLRRGHVVPEGLQAGTSEARRVGDVMSNRFVRDDDDAARETGMMRIVVAPDGAVVGVRMAAGGIAPVVMVEPGAGLPAAMRAMKRTDAAAALVFDDPARATFVNLRGVVGTDEIAQSLHRDAELMD